MKWLSTSVTVFCLLIVRNKISADESQLITEKKFLVHENFGNRTNGSVVKNSVSAELSSLNDALLQEVIVHNSTEKQKVITQREIVQSPETSEIKYNEDVRLFLPPDISIILEAMGNLQDKICKEHVLLTLQALNRREKWAMQMLDSSAKFPSGVLTGSYYQMGNYDECVSVKFTERDQEIPRIKGQYCLAEVHPSEILNSRKEMIPKMSRMEENSTLHWAICVPHSCKPKEISLILDFVLNGAIGVSDAVSVNVSQNMCHFSSNIPYTSQEMIYGYVIVVFVSLISLATFYHVIMYYHKKDGKMPSGILAEIVLSFSAVHNVKKLLSVTDSELNLNCICGIKFLSMILIIASHSLLVLCVGPIINDDFFKEATQKMENGIFLNNPLLVDTYLLISGFLMCRLVLLELDKRKGKVNFLILYIFRYIRLTPVYLVIIGFYCTWFVRLDEGPLWESRITDERDRCINSWWANILYVNNYVNVDQMCMFQSWYLAVDTQLFMLAPLIVYPLWKWATFGRVLLGMSTLISIIVPFVITFRQKLDPTFMLYVPEIRNIFENYYFINAYIKSHMRANSYCFGIVFGYLVHRIQKSNYKIPKFSVFLGWILAAVFTTVSMFSVIIFYSPDYEYNALEAGAYSTLHRVAWCFGIGWILLACITKNSGPVNKFLHWKPFIPLSRLTYCAYLANGIIVLHSYGTTRTPRYLSVYHLACEVLAHLVLTFTLAFLLCIMFESPIHGFEKILLRREKKTRENTQQADA